MKALCIVSNREQHLRDFFCAWQEAGDWDCVVLVEDGPTIEMRGLYCPWPLHHFARGDIEAQLGDDAWIVSQGDTARVSYAFLQAAELGAEWILKLDDDCLPCKAPPEQQPRMARTGTDGPYPCSPGDPWSEVSVSVQGGAGGICARHLAAMRRPRCRSTCDIRVRGLPYRNLGQVESRLNMGLWAGVPDLDGPQSLLSGNFSVRSYLPPAGSTLAHPLERYPLCGMNLFFHASLLPALYFGLQGRGQPYRRFDDIWAGWIFQRVAQHLGIAWSYGEPHIFHSRASDPFRNLVAEAPGIGLNETLWERIDRVKLTAGDLAGAVAELAADLAADGDDYVAALGRALGRWIELTGRR